MNEHSAPGGHAHPTGLQPRSKVRKFPCGCAEDDTQHIAFCDEQQRLMDFHRTRVAEDRRAAASRETFDPLLS
jgi:hypothetical protein